MQSPEITRITIEALKQQRDVFRAKVADLENAIRHHESSLNDSPQHSLFQESSNAGIERPNSSSLLVPSVLPNLIGNIKTLVMSILDEAGKPLRMTELQTRYEEKTGKEYNIREHVRSMNKKKSIKIMKLNGSNRNAYWVRADWVEGGQLKDQYKWEGFDSLYRPEDIKFV